MKLMKNMVIEIHPHGNPDKEVEGDARLIEKGLENVKTETWLVQFKGETRILKRKIIKPELSEPVVISRREPNKILGLDRSDHSELKYKYKRLRR